ncbi:MAG: domain S-box protein, partial [Chthonomonadales bacterium]|nr:domain S-box protein [Chthonomonadales bacterium]
MREQPISSVGAQYAMKAVGVYKKLFGLFLVTVTVLTIMGVFVHLSLQDRESDRWVTRTYEVQSRLQATLLDVEAAQDAHETFHINHSAEALSTLNTSLQKASVDLNILEQLPVDTPDQYARLESLRRSIKAYRSAVEAPGKETMLPSGQPALIQEFILLDKVHRAADSMKQAEQDLLEERIHANRVSQLRVNIALATFLMMVSMLLVALFNAVRQDILQERTAERLRHANDQRIANILENMSDGFYAINEDWVITDMNAQAERLLDRNRSDILGMKVDAVYPDAVGTEFETQYRHAFQEKVPVRFEAFYPPHSAWYAVAIYPYQEGLAIFFTNVNERRKADEERERLARQEMLHLAAQRRNQELQDLARRLVEMQEAERRHLAFELHEEVGQVLAGLKLSLATVMKLPDDVRDNQIRIAQNLVTELMRQVRALSLDLRPGVLD